MVKFYIMLINRYKILKTEEEYIEYEVKLTANTNKIGTQ